MDVTDGGHTAVVPIRLFTTVGWEGQLDGGPVGGARLGEGGVHCGAEGSHGSVGTGEEGRGKGVEYCGWVRFNPSGSTPRLRPAPPRGRFARGGGRISARGRTLGWITFPLLAQRQALPKRSSKRPRFPQCSFQAPRSRRLQYSRGIIPGVLQARLYIEPPYRARNAASAALRERRSPQGERGRNKVAHPQFCETRDR